MRSLYYIATYILTGSILLAACQAPGTIAEATIESSGNEPVLIRVGTGDSGDGLTPHNKIIENFENDNPGEQIELESVPGSNYYKELENRFSAGTAPDIMQIGDDAVPSFVEQGMFIPIDACVRKNNLDLSIYLPGLLSPGRIAGKQYFLPKDYSPLGVFYNKNLFDSANVPYPQNNWTWEDLLTISQALTRDDNGDGSPEIWGIQLPADWTTGFEYWVGAAGGKLISEDGLQFVGYMDSPETIRAVQFYSDLYHKYKVAPPPVDLNTFGGGNNEFREGKAAMYLFGRWPQTELLKIPSINLGVAPPPQDAQRANVLFWGGFGLSSAAANPEAACKFLTYYTGIPGAQVWKDWALPAVTSVAEESGQTADAIEGVWIGELNHLVPRAYTATPYWNETANPALEQALETILADPNADIAEVMAQASATAQAALDKLVK